MTRPLSTISKTLTIAVGTPVTFVRWILTPDGYKTESRDGFFQGRYKGNFLFTVGQSGRTHRLPTSEWEISLP